jgi:branched-chain amino acid transport system ATP-binding protein
VLRVDNLCKSFAGLVVTDNVTMQLQSGETHAVIGPNGAGKTTLFNLLTGEVTPDSGQVLLQDLDITAYPPDARARAGLGRSFQKNNLFDDLTVAENLSIACALHARIGAVFHRSLARYPQVNEAVASVAERIGLQEFLPEPVSVLSYGTRRQIEIALALALEPKVLMLDEPTSGMSPEETETMRKLIAALGESLTILIIEHDMDIVFDLADRITVLDFGKVLVEGEPGEIRDSRIVRDRYFGETVR